MATNANPYDEAERTMNWLASVEASWGSATGKSLIKALLIAAWVGN